MLVLRGGLVSRGVIVDARSGCKIACVISAALARANVSFGCKLFVRGFDGNQAYAQMPCQRTFRRQLFAGRYNAMGNVVANASV